MIMERMKTLRKSIWIDAPREKVWKVLFDERFTRIWYSVFSRGSHPESDWMLGSKALFTDGSQTGLVGRIVEKRTHELLSIEYEGIVMRGREDYESDHAHDVQGAQEVYRLKGNGPRTQLLVECDMGAEFCDTMARAWERALLKIRELSTRL